MNDKVLIANRGEIAVRIARSCASLGLGTVAIYSEDDGPDTHAAFADEAVGLAGTGAPAYLDIAQVLDAAHRFGARYIHPGYGFLSEDATFSRACADAGLTFIGPTPETLELFGNKATARQLASRLGVPVVPGVETAMTLLQAQEFLVSNGPVMVKAVSGGGGRGIRSASTSEELETAFELGSSEALKSFGNGDLYVERWVPRARHIEVQLIGDGTGNVVVLGDRDCSIQRNHQKLIEIAPARFLPETTRRGMMKAAQILGEEARLSSLCTVEFLLDLDSEDSFYFMEANPRLQVEHTITEEVWGVDLVDAQIAIARGTTLSQLGLDTIVNEPQGAAIQVRINGERYHANGSVTPTDGVVSELAFPGGPGIRTDTSIRSGIRTNARFDTLIAKLVVHEKSGHHDALLRRTAAAIRDIRVGGIQTNASMASALLERPELTQWTVTTRFFDEHREDLVRRAEELSASHQPTDEATFITPAPSRTHGPEHRSAGEISAQMTSAVIDVRINPGDVVSAGETLMVLEAMKMEHVITAPVACVIDHVAVQAGDQVVEGQLLCGTTETDYDDQVDGAIQEVDLDHRPPSLLALDEFRDLTRDEQRPSAKLTRGKLGRRTARENIGRLFDEDTFSELGSLAIAAQKERRTIEDLRINTPADGVIVGVGTVNSSLDVAEDPQVAVMAYDYTVLAGTQGYVGHRKSDRIIEMARRRGIPLVLFAEGGGGRAGDTDTAMVSGLDTDTFQRFAELSGSVPLVGIASGYCFAGNAALLGCCDLVIATEDANIGMGGPVMVEGGGMGRFRPEEIGPAAVLDQAGAIDVLVPDEDAAVDVTRLYLSYFQGRSLPRPASDQRLLRQLIPEQSRRSYDIRSIVDVLADEDSVLELRRGYGRSAFTGLIRIDGIPMGVIANDPTHLGGAIDAEAADKMARFTQLCDAHGLPLVSLCDTPGFMVGPAAEAQAAVRRVSRMFVTGANVSIPRVTIILRRAFGLGAQAMAGGSFRKPDGIFAWPAGQVGSMGIEGSIRLGARRELEAIPDPGARQDRLKDLVRQAEQEASVTNAATVFEFDEVIDPIETRGRILESIHRKASSESNSHPRRFVDSW